MTPAYRALLARLVAPRVNLDVVRQRLTGQIGVNPGDRLAFTTELLIELIEQTKDDPIHMTRTVIVESVHEYLVDGDRVKVCQLGIDKKHLSTYQHGPLMRIGRTGMNYGVIPGGIA